MDILKCPDLAYWFSLKGIFFALQGIFGNVIVLVVITKERHGDLYPSERGQRRC